MPHRVPPPLVLALVVGEEGEHPGHPLQYVRQGQPPLLARVNGQRDEGDVGVRRLVVPLVLGLVLVVLLQLAPGVFRGGAGRLLGFSFRPL